MSITANGAARFFIERRVRYSADKRAADVGRRATLRKPDFWKGRCRKMRKQFIIICLMSKLRRSFRARMCLSLSLDGVGERSVLVSGTRHEQCVPSLRHVSVV